MSSSAEDATRTSIDKTTALRHEVGKHVEALSPAGGNQCRTLIVSGPAQAAVDRAAVAVAWQLMNSGLDPGPVFVERVQSMMRLSEICFGYFNSTPNLVVLFVDRPLHHSSHPPDPTPYRQPMQLQEIKLLMRRLSNLRIILAISDAELSQAQTFLSQDGSQTQHWQLGCGDTLDDLPHLLQHPLPPGDTPAARTDAAQVVNGLGRVALCGLKGDSQLVPVVQLLVQALQPLHPATSSSDVGRLGEEAHDPVAQCLKELAQTASMGLCDAAVIIWRAVLAWQQSVSGPDSKLTLNRTGGLANALAEAAHELTSGSGGSRKYASEALALYQQLHQLVKEGKMDVFNEGGVLMGLARCSDALGDHEAALKWWRAASVWLEGADDFWETGAVRRSSHAETLTWAARAQVELGQHAEAEAALRELLKLAQRTHQYERYWAVGCMLHLARAMVAQQHQLMEAEAFLRSVVHRAERELRLRAGGVMREPWVSNQEVRETRLTALEALGDCLVLMDAGAEAGLEEKRQDEMTSLHSLCHGISPSAPPDGSGNRVFCEAEVPEELVALSDALCDRASTHCTANKSHPLVAKLMQKIESAFHSSAPRMRPAAIHQLLVRVTSALGPAHPCLLPLFERARDVILGKWFGRADAFAISVAQDTLVLQQQHLPAGDPKIGVSLDYMAAHSHKEDQQAWLQQFLAWQEQHASEEGRDDIVAQTSLNLGICLMEQQKFAEAEPHLRRAVELQWQPGRHTDISASLKLTECLQGQGQWVEAAQLYMRVICSEDDLGRESLWMEKLERCCKGALQSPQQSISQAGRLIAASSQPPSDAGQEERLMVDVIMAACLVADQAQVLVADMLQHPLLQAPPANMGVAEIHRRVGVLSRDLGMCEESVQVLQPAVDWFLGLLGRTELCEELGPASICDFLACAGGLMCASAYSLGACGKAGAAITTLRQFMKAVRAFIGGQMSYFWIVADDVNRTYCNLCQHMPSVKAAALMIDWFAELHYSIDTNTNVEPDEGVTSVIIAHLGRITCGLEPAVRSSLLSRLPLFLQAPLETVLGYNDSEPGEGCAGSGTAPGRSKGARLTGAPAPNPALSVATQLSLDQSKQRRRAPSAPAPAPAPTPAQVAAAEAAAAALLREEEEQAEREERERQKKAKKKTKDKQRREHHAPASAPAKIAAPATAAALTNMAASLPGAVHSSLVPGHSTAGGVSEDQEQHAGGSGRTRGSGPDEAEIEELLQQARQLMEQGLHVQAEPLLRRAVELQWQPGRHTDISASQALAACLEGQGQWVEAAQLWMRVVGWLSRAGAGLVETMGVFVNFDQCIRQTCFFSEPSTYILQARPLLAACRQLYGEDHEETVVVAFILATCLGECEEAEDEGEYIVGCLMHSSLMTGPAVHIGVADIQWRVASRVGTIPELREASCTTLELAHDWYTQLIHNTEEQVRQGQGDEQLRQALILLWGNAAALVSTYSTNLASMGQHFQGIAMLRTSVTQLSTNYTHPSYHLGSPVYSLFQHYCALVHEHEPSLMAVASITDCYDEVRRSCPSSSGEGNVTQYVTSTAVRSLRRVVQGHPPAVVRSLLSKVPPELRAMVEAEDTGAASGGAESSARTGRGTGAPPRSTGTSKAAVQNGVPRPSSTAPAPAPTPAQVAAAEAAAAALLREEEEQAERERQKKVRKREKEKQKKQAAAVAAQAGTNLAPWQPTAVATPVQAATAMSGAVSTPAETPSSTWNASSWVAASMNTTNVAPASLSSGTFGTYLPPHLAAIYAATGRTLPGELGAGSGAHGVPLAVPIPAAVGAVGPAAGSTQPPTPAAALVTPKRDRNAQLDAECCVCLEVVKGRRRFAVFVPCGHRKCCTECAAMVWAHKRECPYCAQGVSGYEP